MTDVEANARPVPVEARDGNRPPPDPARDDTTCGDEVLDFSPASAYEDSFRALMRLSNEAHSSLNHLIERVKKSETAGMLSRAWETLKQEASREKTDWTVAINLTTDYGSGYGVEARMAELNKLVEKTKGKPVTIVVQAAMPDYSNEEAFLSGQPDGHYLDRYVISDGKMTWIESAKSIGLAKDTEDLLAFTGKKFNPKYFGLLHDSHGNGNLGLTGDTGDATVPEFVEGLRNGLKAMRRPNLDFLDFDCCLMAQDGVVHATKDVAQNVVASAETEHIAGQELTTPLERILENSQLTGEQVAKEFVDASRNRQLASDAINRVLKYFGVDSSLRVPIKTLSHMRIKDYEGFKSSLDNFGDKMVEALKDDKSREAIENAIDETETYGGGGGFFPFFLFFGGGGGGGSTKYDLKDFTQRVVKAIEAGDIKDEDGTLKASAQEVLAQRGKLVRDYFGHGSYEGLGGLSTFLPARDLRTATEERVQRTYTAQLVQGDTGWGRFKYALRRDK